MSELQKLANFLEKRLPFRPLNSVLSGKFFDWMLFWSFKQAGLAAFCNCTGLGFLLKIANCQTKNAPCRTFCCRIKS